MANAPASARAWYAVGEYLLEVALAVSAPSVALGLATEALP
jgi:hypothetical protein